MFCLCLSSIRFKFLGTCQYCPFLESGPITVSFVSLFFYVNRHSDILKAVSGWVVESLFVKTKVAICSGYGLSFTGLLRFLNRYHQIVFWNMNVALGHQFLEYPIKHSPHQNILLWLVQVCGLRSDLTMIMFQLNMDTSCTPKFDFAKVM